MDITAIPPFRRLAFYMASICPDWEGLDIKPSFLVFTSPVFSYDLRRIIQHGLGDQSSPWMRQCLWYVQSPSFFVLLH